jgi:hypothetical protein
LSGPYACSRPNKQIEFEYTNIYNELGSREKPFVAFLKDTTSKKPPGPPDPVREEISRQRFISMYVAFNSVADLPGKLASIQGQYTQLKYFLENPDAVKSMC